MAPTTLHVVRPAERRRGGVGQGVLTDSVRLSPTPGLTRRGGALHLGGVVAHGDRRAGGHAGLRLQRGGHPRALSRARRGARPACRTGSATRSRPTARSPCSACCATSAPAPTSSPAASWPARSRPGSTRRAIVFSGVGKAADELRQAVRAAPRAPERRVAARSWTGWPRSPSEERIDVVGRHPGQSRRHHRHPSLHLDRQERDQVRRAGRPGAGRGGVHRRRIRGSSSTTLAMHLGQPARRTPSRSARGSAGCSSWPTALRADGVATHRGARHRRRPGHPLRRRAADGPGDVRGGRRAAAGADRATPSTSSRGDSWSGARACCSPRCCTASIRAGRSSSWWTRG